MKEHFSQRPVARLCVLCLTGLHIAGGLAAQSAATPPVKPPTPHLAPITGAQIDETRAKTVITVTPATLRAGFQKARANLTAGIATKVVLRPGTYRESLSDLTWDTGKARDTLLVIQGTPGKTVWSGADVFPLSTWKKTPDGLLVHAWPNRFGNLGNFWAPQGNIAYRREMAFVDGITLRPQVLETYQISGLSHAQSTGITYTYLGLRDPAKTLKPGDFGVVERPENGAGRVLVRLPVGVKPGERSIELSVRPILFHPGGKRNLVLRGIDFIRCANPMPDADYHTPGFANGSPVAFSAGAGNIRIDRCRFLWNSGTALSLTGTGWTVRHSVFNNNGLSGISTDGDCRNLVFEGDETSFNCWRSWRAGENDWSYGGIKIQTTADQQISHHLALANCSTGLWWDISCRRVDVTDSVSLENANCDLKYEFSYGPFSGHRLVLGGSKWGPTYICTTTGNGSLDSSIVYKDYPKDHDRTPVPVASLLSYRRGDEPKDPPINRGIYAITDSIVVAGPRTPFVVDDEWWDDPKDDANWNGSTPIFQSVTRDNIYWALGHPPRFTIHLSRTLPLDGSADWSTFQQQAADTGSRLIDPKLVDPRNDDFRIAPDSPLYAQRARWPQYQLPAARLREMRAFFAWLGCPPEGPSAPPKDEP